MTIILLCYETNKTFLEHKITVVTKQLDFPIRPCIISTTYLTNVAESFDIDIHFTAFTAAVCPDIPNLCFPLVVHI